MNSLKQVMMLFSATLLGTKLPNYFGGLFVPYLKGKKNLKKAFFNCVTYRSLQTTLSIYYILIYDTVNFLTNV